MTRLAAIDCGTNTLRLLIVELGDKPRDLIRTAKIVRLGEGVDATGSLAATALERARAALVNYRAELDKHQVDRVRMVATSATRDASNGAEFSTMVHETLGIIPEVISGDEEARLSYHGAVAALGDGPFLVLDIGGGSTELIAGDNAEQVSGAISLDMGAVRLTERHLPGDPPSADEVATATAAIKRTLATADSVVMSAPRPTMVGVAGTVITLAVMAMGVTQYRPMLGHGYELPLSTVERLTAELIGATRAERTERYPIIEAGRIDIIGAGALILREAMRAARVTSIRASEHDILDGIIASIAQR